MTYYRASQMLTLWNAFSILRYGSVNIPPGILNFSVAFTLYYYGVLGHHSAIAVGHFLQVGIGFFAERRVTFRASHVTFWVGMPKFLINEAIVYGLIYTLTYVTVDLWGVDTYTARVFLITPLSSVVAFLLNKHVAFR